MQKSRRIKKRWMRSYGKKRVIMMVELDALKRARGNGADAARQAIIYKYVILIWNHLKDRIAISFNLFKALGVC
jgi:hypothetical protein